MNLSQYRLRKAAGIYWIIKTNQQEADYMEPIQINEAGALIWNGIESGCGEDELAQLLQEHFDIDSYKAICDVRKFMEQLYKKGISEVIDYLQ